MAERVERYRIHSHMTRSRFLHVEDALDIGKVRLFAGEYIKGKGAQTLAMHYLDVADARVLLNDLAWGKPVDYCEFKGTCPVLGPWALHPLSLLRYMMIGARCGTIRRYRLLPH